MMDSLTESIRKEAPWQMVFAVDVVLCAREKGELELVARKTEAEMDGLCQPRHESHRNAKDEVHDRIGWRRIVSAAATPQPSDRG